MENDPVLGFLRSIKWGSFSDAFWGFIDSVDWTQPWLRSLIAMHVVLLMCIITFRRNINLQIALFLTMLVSVLLARHINYWCANNWTSFATENYFDSHGFFISIVFSGPFMLMTLIILINFVFEAGRMLVLVKRQQLKSEQKQKQKKDK